MNKKVSTLLTVALTLGGSLLSSSAFAETLPIGKKVNDLDNKFENGGIYFLIQDGNLDPKTNDVALLGQSYADPDTDQKILNYIAGKSTLDTYTKEELKQYMWKVVKADPIQGKGGETVYKLQNISTGKYLVVNNTNGTYTFNTSAAASTETAATTVAFGASMNPYTNGSAKMLISSTLMDNTSTPGTNDNSNDTNNDDKAIVVTDFNAQIVSRTDPNGGNGYINLYSVDDEDIETPEAGELNDLYNRAGFNFKVEEGVANIFGEGKVKAIHVKVEDSDGLISDAYGFPNGTYFATETPVGSYPTEIDSNNPNISDANKLKAAQLEYLKGCTFIAVDPDNNVSDDKDLQKEGKGFTLTTVAAKDLNLYTETRPGAVNKDLETKGSQVSVFNACFIGWHNATKPGQYALALNNVRYQKEADKEAHEAKALAINVIKVHYGSTKYLATDAMDKNYVFTLEASSAVNPADKEAGILKENAAAIYNIQFMSGDAADHESEYGKYLTFVNAQPDAAATTTYKEWWAKGEAIADLNTPAYQFVITNVSGNDITFTNRETGEKFTAQLFEEEEGVYSLALSAITGFTSSLTDVADATYCVADVKDNGDVEKVNNTFKLNEALIQLVPVAEVDKFDGFLNVEDETIMTLAFARDFTPTSNKLYPVVDDKNNFPKKGVKLTDEVSDAVEFMLVKEGKPKYTTHNYFYLNDAGKAVVKNWGDTVAVQSYKMKLVNDGTPVNDKYININNSNVSLGTATSVIIKNNPDGSVAIKESKDATKYLSVNKYNASDFDKDCGITMAGVSSQPKATDVKTYLFNDSPVISWKAERGHVTLQTEMGNYITSNEENVGIVTSNEAETFYLHVADTKASVPSFFISKGKGENSNAESERMFLFNPTDSVPYLVNAPVDTKYQWNEESNKAIFKSGKLNTTADTLTTTIKGKEALVAQKADNKNVQGGLDKFKFQIIEAEEGGYYYIRQVNNEGTNYLRNLNGKLTWTINRDGSNVGKSERVLVAVKDAEAPTSNENVAASEVKVIANNGSINVKNAAGKNVVVSTILGQVVANEVLTSDNATINVPAGIVVVSVDGESFKVNVK